MLTFFCLDHDFSDDDYSYSQSYDDPDQFGVSPTTREMYTYKSEGRQIFAAHLPGNEYSIDEHEFELQNEETLSSEPAAASKPSPKPVDRSTSVAIPIGGRPAAIEDLNTPKPQRQPRKNRRSKG